MTLDHALQAAGEEANKHNLVLVVVNAPIENAEEEDGPYSYCPLGAQTYCFRYGEIEHFVLPEKMRRSGESVLLGMLSCLRDNAHGEARQLWEGRKQQIERGSVDEPEFREWLCAAARKRQRSDPELSVYLLGVSGERFKCSSPLHEANDLTESRSNDRNLLRESFLSMAAMRSPKSSETDHENSVSALHPKSGKTLSSRI